MVDEIALGKILVKGFGQEKGSLPSSSSTILGTAVSNSLEGRVSVQVGGEVLSVESTFVIQADDEVLLTLVGARPIVTGVVARGDEQAKRVDETASEVLSASQAAHDAQIQAEYAAFEAARLDTEVKSASQLALDARLCALTAEAKEASKAKVWQEEPAPPYEAGQLWLQSDEGIVMVCVAAREDGDYASDDWRRADSYATQRAFDALSATTASRFETTEAYLLSEVKANYVTTTDFSEATAHLASQLVQTNNAITMSFLESVQAMQTVADEFTSEKAQRATYLRFSGDGIDVGRADNDLTAHMDNTRLAFSVAEGLEASSYLSNEGLKAPVIETASGITIGKGSLAGVYSLAQMSNGNLSLRYKGGV